MVTAKPAGSTYRQVTTSRLLLSKPGTSRVVRGCEVPGSTTCTRLGTITSLLPRTWKEVKTPPGVKAASTVTPSQFIVRTLVQLAGGDSAEAVPVVAASTPAAAAATTAVRETVVQFMACSSGGVPAGRGVACNERAS